MPEGPEVKNITNSLHSLLAGQLLLDIGWDQRSKYSPNGPLGIHNLRDYFPARLERVFCKGKQIFFGLISIKYRSFFYFNSGLGMAGSWILTKGNHSNLWLDFGKTTASGRHSLRLIEKRIYFDDSRHFGNFKVLWGKKSLDKRLSEIGPDILSGTLDLTTWTKIVQRRRKSNLVSFLMNQRYLSGVGNYLAAEILYRAKLKPDRLVNSLSGWESRLLWATTLNIADESYRANGLTIKDYQDPEGRKGHFECQVYGKTKDPFGNPVIKSQFFQKRSTHWVPTVQI